MQDCFLTAVSSRVPQLDIEIVRWLLSSGMMLALRDFHFTLVIPNNKNDKLHVPHTSFWLEAKMAEGTLRIELMGLKLYVTYANAVHNGEREFV